MAAPDFADHFSAHAATYALYRPKYPPALFDWLRSESNGHLLAWDCATGNGQAARSLAAHFDRVIATDASAAQIEAAETPPQVELRVAPAEHSGIVGGSVDLVCVAQAAHWFDQGAFHREVDRVLKPNGLLAIWGYGLCRIGADLDPALVELYSLTLGEFWPQQRRHIDQGYRSLPFPYPEIDPPVFVMSVNWSRQAFLGYLSSWSAVQRYRADRAHDPLLPFAAHCARTWRNGERRTVTWPWFMRAGRKPA